MNGPLPPLVSFPFGGAGPDGALRWATGNHSVRECILNVLLTRPGERLMRPGFGAGLRRFVHQPNNETTRALIADAASRAIQRWEPRVILEEVRVLPDPDRPAHVNLSIRYRLRSDRSPGRLDLSLALGGAG